MANVAYSISRFFARRVYLSKSTGPEYRVLDLAELVSRHSQPEVSHPGGDCGTRWHLAI